MRAFCTSSSPSARASCDATCPCASGDQRVGARLRVGEAARVVGARGGDLRLDLRQLRLAPVARRLTADSALARASAISAFFCTSADCLRPMLSR
jgi:hypothetical protein